MKPKVDWSYAMVPKAAPTRLTGKAKTELRRQVYERDRGRCQGCGIFVPISDQDGNFNLWTCGHRAHIKSKGSGGDDSLENSRWLCYTCHIDNGGEHGPRWTR